MKSQSEYTAILILGIIILAGVITYRTMEERIGCSHLIDGAYDQRCEASK